MSSTLLARCADCDFYIPIDVFKGVCHVNKKTVLTDEAACEACVPVRKCKFCGNFSATSENLGLCKGMATAYPEMVARTCEMFRPLAGASQAGLRGSAMAASKPSPSSRTEAARR